MKVLVIGSGAREHAISKALHASPQNPALFCYGASINPGIKQFTSDYQSRDVTDCEAVVKQAGTWGIQLAIIGPEAPLETGLADALWQAGIPTIGPEKMLAQIETSKEFARDLMKKYRIAGLPKYRQFANAEGIQSFLQELGDDYVVKANGLMSGKGVRVSGDHLHSHAEALAFCEEIFRRKQTVLIEEKLSGQEFSFMCFADGKHLVPMPLVQDHKRADNGDKGPNTGGMGSYSDANHSLPFLTPEERDEALAINQAAFQALTEEFGKPYIGILYGSFMATRNGVFVIEFNARFGDPEALNVLSLLESDFLEICQLMVKGQLTQDKVRFANKASVCTYLVPEGSPDTPLTGFPLELGTVGDGARLYLSSVNQVGDELLGAGGRTAAFVGVADSIEEAFQCVEQEVSAIRGPMFYRQDIGTAELIRQRIQSMQEIRNS